MNRNQTKLIFFLFFASFLFSAYVRLGELDERSNLCETDSSICSQRQDFEIESIIYHEQYDSPKFANDIALIRLRMAANSSKNILFKIY